MKRTLAVTICALIGLTLLFSFYMYRNETDRRLNDIESNIASLSEDKEPPAEDAPVSADAVGSSQSVPAAPSDAGDTAEALAQQMAYLINLLPTRYASAFSWEYGKTIHDDGTEEEYSRSALSDPFPVEPNDILVNLSSETDSKKREVTLSVAAYANGEFLQMDPLASGIPYIVDENVSELRLVCSYTPKDDASMTADLLRSVFRLKYKGSEAHGDGSRPVYVAFGDSITVGTIHHYTGLSTSHSARDYPHYVGDILGLETYNKGRGTTGFLARAGGKSPNYMDSVYLNDELLSKASLITIMVGYGNDNLAGLPIGEWDDYYPYDEAGCFYVSGDTAGNKKGIETMLDGGATLFGCMNWTIKWIGEHYPRAELIVIFGAPGKNANLTAVVEGNTGDPEAGTRGHAPQKIVTAVSESDDEISDKLEKLQTALNIPIIDLHREGLPYSYYSSYSQNEDGTYALFSTKGTPEDPVWNSHPSEEGYLLYARYLAGRISDYFMH